VILLDAHNILSYCYPFSELYSITAFQSLDFVNSSVQTTGNKIQIYNFCAKYAIYSVPTKMCPGKLISSPENETHLQREPSPNFAGHFM